MAQPPISPVSSPSLVSSGNSLTLVSRHVAQRRIRHILDGLAKYIVGAGGLATIVSILGIFVYLVWEVLPLFQPATSSPELILPVPLTGTQASERVHLLVGIDEYREVPFVLQGKHLQFVSLPGGIPMPEVGGELPIGGEPTSVARMGPRLSGKGIVSL
jgi:phosphate transport system permease protein